MGDPVSLIGGHIEESAEKHRLRVAFKHVNYTPIYGAVCKANLCNQFSEYALDDILDQLIKLGVTIKDYE